MAVVTLMASGQSVLHMTREREHLWNSRPGKWLVVSCAVDLEIVTVLASFGTMTAALPVCVTAGLLGRLAMP